MYIRCWGSRGSIPVSGKDYLKYGGDTTCMEIRARSGELIVVDAGTGIRPLGRALLKGGIKSLDLLFTHAHWDHMIGFPFFGPVYTKGYSITIRGYPYGRKTFRNIIAGFMRCPYFPVSLGDKDIRGKLTFKKIDKRPFPIGSIHVTPIPLSHPKKGGRGFHFREGGKTFVFLTDNELNYIHNDGLSFDEYVSVCRGADLLIHDGEYDSKDYSRNRSWGHSLFTDAVRLGIEAGVKRLGLFHLNSRRTDAQVDKIVAQARSIIAKAGSSVECFAVGSMFKITL
jgi:phosphoribosyl 1,2-cyclic phosphodiesterase